MTDFDGNTFDIVRINGLIWMKENLKVTTFNDGWTIPTFQYPGNDENNLNDFGLLYNAYFVNTEKLCPSGWHISTDSEWNNLITYLNGAALAGAALKEVGTVYWQDPNTGANNESGFSASVSFPIPRPIKLEKNL